MQNEIRLLVHGKGGKIQHQNLWPQSAKLLKQYIQTLPKNQSPTDPLFPNLRNVKKPLTTRAIRLRVDMILRQAGIEEGKSCHSLRHALGSLMAESGASLTSIQQKLRHSDLRVTLKYINVIDHKNRNIIKYIEGL